MRILLAVILLLNLTMFASSQENKDFAIYDAKGNQKNLADIINDAKNVDVVFLGENHDDSVAHRLQFEIFKAIIENYSKDRKIALSLEMFERDVQIILDEYLDDLITERHFLASSRPWGNYETDYKPLVELAKEKKYKVVAANTPRRYVNMVSRNGRKSLDNLNTDAKNWLAPLPFGEPSKAYADKFNKLMGGHGSSNILDSQTLWDATMAYSISENLKKNEDALIVHLNGSFHTESRIGTPDQLLKYSPNAKFLVVTMKYVEDFKNFDKEKYEDIGDYVILTDAKAPRSKR